MAVPGALRRHYRHRGRESRSGVAGAATETRRAHGYTGRYEFPHPAVDDETRTYRYNHAPAGYEFPHPAVDDDREKAGRLGGEPPDAAGAFRSPYRQALTARCRADRAS